MTPCADCDGRGITSRDTATRTASIACATCNPVTAAIEPGYTRDIVLRVHGKPTGKGRPRFVKATGRAFTPGDTLRAENRVQLAWMDAGGPRLPDGPVVAFVEVVMARPQGHWKRDGTLSASGQRALWPMKKPDLDNVLKLVGDSLNAHAYRDDADIVDARIVRRWANPGEDEHMIVRLWTAPTSQPVEAVVA